MPGNNISRKNLVKIITEGMYLYIKKSTKQERVGRIQTKRKLSCNVCPYERTTVSLAHPPPVFNSVSIVLVAFVELTLLWTISLHVRRQWQIERVQPTA